VAVAAIVCALGVANPQPAEAADPLQGKAETCAACHGLRGHSSMAKVPSLAGQPAHYLSLQLWDQARAVEPACSTQ
jgi:cytochrome c553